MSCLYDCGPARREQKGSQVEYPLSDGRVSGLLSLAGALLAEGAAGVYEGRRDCPAEEQPG